MEIGERYCEVSIKMVSYLNAFAKKYMSLKQEGTQMANFFKKIDMLQSSPKSDRHDYLFNLDKFHTIHRNNNQVIAKWDDNSSIVIAVCKTPAGAEYIMDCIEAEIEINYHQLNLREREQ